MYKQIILLCLSIAFFAACSGNKKAQKTTTKSEKISTTAANDQKIAMGKSIYNQHCGSCHKLKNPQDFSEPQWAKIVPAMVQKTNKKANAEVVDAQKQADILAYVLWACKKQ